MERISEPLHRKMKSFEDSSAKPDADSAPLRPSPQVKGYNCPLCKDMRFVYLDVPTNDPRFGKAHPCLCQQGINEERRRQHLQQIDGLTNAERNMYFHRLLLHDGNRDAVEIVERAISVRRGMVTLSGPPGTGKTSLLICAVNATREANVPSVYTTMSDLLAYLRSAFDPQREYAVNYDARWELLLSAEVLAIDELDEFSATSWAMERFMRLIDERWRHMDSRLTLLATNTGMESLPPKIASRLRDGRAAVVPLSGSDLRPLREWDDK